MLNYLWAGMILVAIFYGTMTGNLDQLTDAALNSAQEAVELCIVMMGVMAFWVGIMEIAQETGMIKALARRMKPVLRFLFPELPENHKACEHVTTNIIANIMGLGWAATPAGLRAMEELGKLEEERRRGKLAGPVRKSGIASDEMCTFLVLNISSLQLIPVNVIAYRSQYGSVNPAAIVGPGILATAVSTAVAVVFCKVMNRRKRRIGRRVNCSEIPNSSAGRKMTGK